MLYLATLPPLSLYVHFPWCIKKCPYCDFNSHEWRNSDHLDHLDHLNLPEDEYLNALRADLESALPLIWGRRVYTVFIGGGTPSLMSARGVDRLLSDLRALLPLDTHAEITLEANPGTFEAEKFRQFHASGINRLSMGIQSFNDMHLKALGRIHDARQARGAIEMAQRTFDNFNLDLMFALPHQTLEACYADVEAALSYAPPHLSLYQLTLEANTYFAKYPPPLPDEDTAAEMQDWIHERLQTGGYQRYEVSAYARNHRYYCQHNLNYWHFGDYLGIGAGAHSKLSFPDRIIRQVRYKHPATYYKQCEMGHAIQEEKEISVNDLPFEFMLNALRLPAGFPVNHFVERTGLPFSAIETSLAEAETRGLISRDYQTIAPTPLGQRFLNDLQALFLKTRPLSTV